MPHAAQTAKLPTQARSKQRLPKPHVPRSLFPLRRARLDPLRLQLLLQVARQLHPRFRAGLAGSVDAVLVRVLVGRVWLAGGELGYAVDGA
jgi:hypothetical protein